MPRAGAGVLLAVVLGSAVAADAGHEIPYYPSFYPQQITVRALGPASAAAELARGALHAWVGDDPFQGRPAPAHVAYVESLAGFVVLTFTPGAPAAADAAARCAAAAALARALPEVSGFVPHPYPITPYHEAYVAHADRIAERREAAVAGPVPAVRIRATGRPVRWLEAAGRPPVVGEADAVLEEVPLERLLGAERTDFAGRPGPPWVKDGVEQAYRLLADAVDGHDARREVEALHRELQAPGLGAATRLERGRRLVGLLTAGCRRAVVGYTTRREPVNTEYSSGVENVAWDSQEGLGSAVFVRTVKLKDFPWNGLLEVGVPAAPAAAWNPVAGFTDPAGRLLWAALADPALIPAPRADGWLDNRVRVVSVEPGPAAVEAPAGTFGPDPARGLRRSERPAPAGARVVYEVRASRFHDGSAMTFADVLAPYALAARQGAGSGPRFDPVVARATAPARRALVGVRLAGARTDVKEFGDVQVLNDVLVVEVFLAEGGDPRWLPALAPPWSPVPWTVLALGEEAVARGLAAWSADAARGRPWLDLARDAGLARRLDALAAEFERRGWVPEALRELVGEREARRRWAALRQHYRRAGHFMVTNGPYRLVRWTTDRVVLEAFRDLSYPLVVGTFDRHAYPRRAFVTAVDRRADRLEIRADVEAVVREGRSVRLERVPLRVEGGRPTAAVEARWVTLDDRGRVVAAGASGRLEGDRVVVEPAPGLPPGHYRVWIALTVDGNAVNPEVQQVAYPVPG
jgi:hypothetical protein